VTAGLVYLEQQATQVVMVSAQVPVAPAVQVQAGVVVLLAHQAQQVMVLDQGG
jgi:hypothetical protein